MDTNLTPKAVLIVLVIAACGWTLYPPSETLDFGIDLVGGTSLVYEVDMGKQKFHRARLRNPEDPKDSADFDEIRKITVSASAKKPLGSMTLRFSSDQWSAEAARRYTKHLANAADSKVAEFATEEGSPHRAVVGGKPKGGKRVVWEVGVIQKSGGAPAFELHTLRFPGLKGGWSGETAEKYANAWAQALGLEVKKFDRARAELQGGQRDIMQRLIAVLQRRVDPKGTRNLKWRVQAGNRIQIQMPNPGEEVRKKREAYRSQLRKIREANISRPEVMAALKKDGEAWSSAKQRLVKGIKKRRELLSKAHDAYAKKESLEKEYEEAKKEGNEQKQVKLAPKLAKAERQLDATLNKLMETNVDVDRLVQILEMSTQPPAGAEKSPRKRRLQSLYEKYESRADQIRKLVKAYDSYFKHGGEALSVADLKRLIQGAGVLEFRITVRPSEVSNIKAKRKRLREEGPEAASTPRMRWFAIDDLTQWTQNSDYTVAEVRNPEKDPTPAQFFAARHQMVAGTYGGKIYVLLWNTPGRSLTERDGDWKLADVNKTRDRKNLPAVGFEMNSVGADLLRRLTRNNRKRRMAIVLDGRVYSAPTIQSAIGKRGQISGGKGGFSEQELNYLVRTLDAGALPARLSSEPVSERSIEPSMGEENLRQGFFSAVLALILVGLFMMAYYFYAGVVTNVALAANIVIILGVLASWAEATFTLPGIAGIVLTIGMCVDANVLIFERIREELRGGADGYTALRLGYDRAFSSVIDANLTNLIVCIILYILATPLIKSFALTLGIGICATLFTALFMTRVIFDLWNRYLGLERIPMLPLQLAALERLLHPAISWIRLRWTFFAVSLVLVAGSLTAIVVRGENLLDIEFRAGTDVTFQFQKGKELSRQQVVKRLKRREALQNPTVVAGETDEGRASFSVMTTEEDARKVGEIIRETFDDRLKTKPPIAFAGADAKKVAEAPVYRVDEKGRLADGTNVLEGHERVQEKLSDYQGGAVLRNLRVQRETEEGKQTTDRGVSLAQIEERIQKVQATGAVEGGSNRDFEVVGLERARIGEEEYRTAAILVAGPAVAPTGEQQWREEVASPMWKLVRESLRKAQSLERVTNYEPTVARRMRDKATVAIVVSFLAIVFYIWFRFGSLRYGLAALTAVSHDVIITVGLVAASAYIYRAMPGNFLLIEPFRLNMGLVAAILTIIGYSLNDTIVAFDRIRENRGRLAVVTPAVIDRSINQVISRSVNTSLTTLLAVLTMYVVGGSGIHGFAFALVVGVIVGTYSSVGIASPLLLLGTGQPAPQPRPEPVPAGPGRPAQA